MKCCFFLHEFLKFMTCMTKNIDFDTSHFFHILISVYLGETSISNRYRVIHRNCPQRRTSSQNGGSASRIHQHTAQKRGSASRIHQPKGGSASRFHQLDGGPPLEFVNIQPPKRGSASRIHQHTAPKRGSHTACTGFQTTKKIPAPNLAFQAFERFMAT